MKRTKSLEVMQCAPTYVHMCLHSHTFMCMEMYISIQTYIYTYIMCVYVYTYMHAHKHLHLHRYYICIYTYTSHLNLELHPNNCPWALLISGFRLPKTHLFWLLEPRPSKRDTVGPQELPGFWSDIPNIAAMSDTSNIPQNDISVIIGDGIKGTPPASVSLIFLFSRRPRKQQELCRLRAQAGLSAGSRGWPCAGHAGLCAIH